ncbi:MAG TPA: glycosyltransferase family 2 protein [Vicinamibacterales bacterium]|jgi:cellulose synthase/poly-beta-1,6-N-acetylglucosamine synthase-like glycosyltransferase|nr:glycosyltransferase [Acidobacteriota bacterium]HQX80521.1 glycosyltransferase family 2 protein [Vicinamibacterales bacterium]
MQPYETLILVAYFFVLSILGIYGWHRYYLVYEYMKNKDRVPGPPPPMKDLPVVTIQLPIFNEMYVADRLIDSVCDIDYPKDKLEIQVLDDSTDETREIAAMAVERQAALGFDIKYLHRTNRVGYKAGALDEALKVARGEFVAIFDADFVPTADFLMKTVGYFQDPKVALVQARWGHINQNYSLLTKIQAILLDGHFVLEHGGRNRAGCFFNFNGTAGVWRRTAIGDAGGWQHDTLTEDLDLSYRAQLRGWRFLFLPHLVTPAEVPVEMNAFKSQQHRWAKGSIQTCRKVLPAILASNLPRKVKIEAFFHLTANFNYLLMCLLSVLMFPAMVVRYNMGWTEMLLIDVPLFFVATASVFNFYLVSQRELYTDWVTRVKYLPVVMAIGIGLAVNNTKAVFEALFGAPGEFTRTAKYGISTSKDGWQNKKYHQAMSVQPIIELALGLYFSATVVYALAHGIYGTLPFLLLFQFGFLYVGLTSILQQLGDGVMVKAPKIAD